MDTALEVEDLTFRYRRDTPELFDHLTHAFAPGAVTALTGASGRGKSTLLYVLGLMLTPGGGRVILDGRDVGAAPDAQRSHLRATRLGFVFQDSQLDPTRTLWECVCEPGLYADGPQGHWRERGLELLDQFGLGEPARSPPIQISGGQAQRVAVCRALLVDPGVVLADEPTGNLDRSNAEAVLEALSSTARSGCTVIIATHDPFVLEHADEVVAL
ncbi:MAG: ATP-binding cassette domain-containing protein [Actinomyces sp.]|nr:ATP-binding cassette domain-containing protein [Actinomyces sp.]